MLYSIRYGLYVCIYIYFYPLRLMFDDCTFLHDCIEFENVTDTRRGFHKRRSINEPRKDENKIPDSFKDRK